MNRSSEDLDKMIEEKKALLNDLRTFYAQPYIKNFRKSYLWSDEDAEKLYNRVQSELSALLIQKNGK
jgi:hypothetical protein